MQPAPPPIRFPRRPKSRGRRIAAGVVALALLAGFSAQAALTTSDRAPPAIATAPRTVATPAAATIPAVSPEERPTPGVTGTIALPDIPVPEVAAGDTSVRPARPFVLAGSAVDKARALQCLTTAIYYEAASEPDQGQAAVAQVILNRVRHPAFPASVCGVVYQGSERPVCQFSFACDGAMARTPSPTAWARARLAAARALGGFVFAPVGLATHYHTYAVTPSWNRTLVMTGVFGAHFFHRWKGWWGTGPAFHQAYSGVEPYPGPHARNPEAPIAASDPQAIAAATAALLRDAQATAVAAKAPPVTPTLSITPEHRAAGTLLPAYAQQASGDDQILDRWKDSGKPLR